MVELGQAGNAEPRLVAVGVVDEVVVTRFRRFGIGLGRLEPFMAVAGVVERQIGHQLEVGVLAGCS